MKFLIAKRVKVETINANHIIDGNPKMIMSLFFNMVLATTKKDFNGSKIFSNDNKIMVCKFFKKYSKINYS